MVVFLRTFGLSLIAILFLGNLISSCSIIHLEKRKYTKGYSVFKKKNQVPLFQSKNISKKKTKDIINLTREIDNDVVDYNLVTNNSIAIELEKTKVQKAVEAFVLEDTIKREKTVINNTKEFSEKPIEQKAEERSNLDWVGILFIVFLPITLPFLLIKTAIDNDLGFVGVSVSILLALFIWFFLVCLVNYFLGVNLLSWAFVWVLTAFLLSYLAGLLLYLAIEISF